MDNYSFSVFNKIESVNIVDYYVHHLRRYDTCLQCVITTHVFNVQKLILGKIYIDKN